MRKMNALAGAMLAACLSGPFATAAQAKTIWEEVARCESDETWVVMHNPKTGAYRFWALPDTPIDAMTFYRKCGGWIEADRPRTAELVDATRVKVGSGGTAVDAKAAKMAGEKKLGKRVKIGGKETPARLETELDGRSGYRFTNRPEGAGIGIGGPDALITGYCPSDENIGFTMFAGRQLTWFQVKPAKSLTVQEYMARCSVGTVSTGASGSN